MTFDQAHEILLRENARNWREPLAAYGPEWDRQVEAALCAAVTRSANDLDSDIRARARRRRLVSYVLGLLQQERSLSGS